ncbi:MAG TPA: hypothetical protein VEG64_14200 [Candidatus Sulfotelmatobacter sp.]|nr:hypothetical protein [Candidatus Sulfotelmatobacter sp.]
MPVYSRSYWPSNQFGYPHNLRIFGPLISVEIGVPQALAQHLSSHNLPVPAPVPGVALIDTGASITSVDNSVFRTLRTQPVSIATVGGAHGSAQQSVYPASISFPGTALQGLDFNQVLGCDISGQATGLQQPLIALVGRDLLQHFVFIYHGPMGLITFAH